MKKAAAPLVLSLFMVSSCVTGNENQTFGTLLGGAGGAALGAQFGKGKGKLVGVAVGALAGAFIGGSIGKSMDENSRRKHEQTTQQALEYAPTGQAGGWTNPDKKASGTITPTHTYQDPTTGRYCREYTQMISIGGQEEKAYGKACRQPDGTWQLVE